MRYLLFLCTFTSCLLAAPAAIGLTVQECAEIKAVYGWAPESCVSLSANAQAAGAPPVSVPQTTEPTSQQLENHIFFPGGGTALDSKALQQIDTLSQLLNGTVLGNACIALVGHSDTSGGEVANMQVAQSRAEAVGAAFRSRLNNPLKIERVLSAGESLPLENISPRSRWQRRVEIRARDCAISM
jgi:outer membrane protein OmpA-like peptidoglycan-associated protein